MESWHNPCMIVTGHQPNYLPYPGFFEKIARSDLFVVVDNVQFVKRGPFGWIHRNKIKKGADWDWLTIPVLTKGKYEQTIQETKINSQIPWARKHWRSLEFNYRKAPHFAEYADDVKAIYDQTWDGITDLNVAFIRQILKWLSIDVPVKISSEEGISGKSTDLVVDICKKTGANTYLSGIHGKDYLDLPKFEEAGLQVEFQDFVCPAYPQTPPEPFIPNLSILDLIFNCGPQSRRLILG